MARHGVTRVASNLGRGLSRRGFLKMAGGLAGTIIAGSTQQLSAATPLIRKGPAGKLVIATGVDLDTFDPHVMLSAAMRGVIKNVFEALVDREEQPLLATRWEVLGDLTWRFELRQGVKFHNGDAFDAEAVKFSFERFVDPKTKAPYARQLEPVKRVEILDKYTVKIITSTPYGTLLDALADVEIVSPRAVQEEAGGGAWKKPVGTGRFKYVEWLPADRVVIEANEGYWGSPPLIRTVIWRPIPEPSTRVIALRTGEVDIVTHIPAGQASAISGPGMHVERVAAMSQIPVTLNCQDKPFSDMRARQAINYAVNKEELIRVILDGAGQVANGPLTPSHPGYDSSLKPYPYDLTQAKKLLAEAGYASGFSITFQSPRGRFAKDQQIAEALVGQLAQVGIKLNANVMEYTTLLKVYRKEGHGFILPANMTTTQRQLDAYFSSSKKMFAWYGYVNPKVDELLDMASKTFKRDKRLGYYSQASRIIRDEAAFLYLFDEQHLYGVRDRVKSWQPRGDELILLGGTSVEG
jgi:peptide/nickel transport system substrate-binding protein